MRASACSPRSRGCARPAILCSGPESGGGPQGAYAVCAAVLCVQNVVAPTVQAGLWRARHLSEQEDYLTRHLQFVSAYSRSPPWKNEAASVPAIQSGWHSEIRVVAREKICTCQFFQS